MVSSTIGNDKDGFQNKLQVLAAHFSRFFVYNQRMICPRCGYMMDAFDKECPRCHGKGVAAPPQAPPLPSATTAPRPPAPSAVAVKSKNDRPNVGCLALFGGALVAFIGAVAVYAVFGIALGNLIWLGTCIAVLVDANQIGARKGVVGQFGDQGPWGWFFACLLIWVVAFPCYLMYRPHFVEANQ